MPVRTAAGAALLITVFTAPASAEDYFLTIGGGYSRSGNQVSLERNVMFQREVLARVRPDAAPPEVYFADGDSGNADLQYRDPDYKTKCPRARRMMGRLFGDWGEVDLRYREHELSELAGPAEPDLLRRRMKKLAAELSDGDRLIIYFTGHGGEADNPNDYGYYDDDDDSSDDEYNEHDTKLYLWDNEEVTASELSSMLDRLPEGVTVVMVMVQCFSGGFAHTIFHHADAELGLAPHKRCGFFSQRHDRYAAGCTPDINEADYQEYSSFFWAAIGGRTRSGDAIINPNDGSGTSGADYDGDGRVSMAEAHAYAVIESDTIDIPIRTTGALLRKYSTLSKNQDDAGEGSESDENPLGALLGIFNQAADGEKPIGERLAKLSGPLQKLADRARPDQRAILKQLPAVLGLSDAATVESVRAKLKQLEQRRIDADARVNLAYESWSNAIERLNERLTERWPELETPYSPLSMALASERADEFIAALESLPQLEAFQKADERYDEALERSSEADHLEAKAERLLRTCENIVLAANLPLVAPEEIVDRYEQLLAIEESGIDAPAGDRGE